MAQKIMLRGRKVGMLDPYYYGQDGCQLNEPQSRRLTETIRAKRLIEEKTIHTQQVAGGGDHW